MSRTYKDVPYSVLARRKGRKITSCGPNCGKPLEYISSYRGIIKTTDQTTLRKIKETAEELEYDIHIKEKYGYLNSYIRSAYAQRHPLAALLRDEGEVLGQSFDGVDFIYVEYHGEDLVIDEEYLPELTDEVDAYQFIVNNTIPYQKKFNPKTAPDLYLEITVSKHIIKPHSCPESRGERFELPVKEEKRYRCRCNWCRSLKKQRIKDNAWKKEEF